MAKGNWKKNNKLNSTILQILHKKKLHLTTRQIQQILYSEYNIKRSWQTIQRYLSELADLGHIASEEIERPKNTIRIWKE
jgi:hypothetical protein